jgi:Uroporphyrinogen-III decarboxylase
VTGMTNALRVKRALAGETSGLDRLPMLEWASWWDLTLKRWADEGLPMELGADERYRTLGMDVHRQCWFRHKAPDCPRPLKQGGGIMADESDYERIKPYLYPGDEPRRVRDIFAAWEEDHGRGDVCLWFSMDGGFWFPRTLFGIESHFYSFYDEPELYSRILDDLADYQLKVLEQIYAVSTPEFMTLAEDMSYNKGPMLSRKLFMEFIYPYYRRVIPFIRAHGTRVLIDSDGDISEMVPWLIEAGVEGALPLEYQAGVDVKKLRADFPEFIMLGGFNKRIMKDGEEAMRREFERLLPVMRAGRFIPSVDHQTPPDVPLENYRVYVRLMEEYARKAVLP